MRALTKYFAVARVQLLNAFAYPIDLFARSFTMILFMWVFFQLWKTTYAASETTAIAGLTLRDTLWYLMIAETVILSRARFDVEIEAQVKEGSIAYLLNKPYHFLLYQASVTLAESILRMGVNALFGGTIVWLAVGPPPVPAMIPVVIVAMLLAWSIDFCISALIALGAFVVEDVAAFRWIYSKLVLVLGGVLIPLDFFPDWLRRISLSMPFAYTTYAPGRIFVDPSLESAVILLGRQALWLAALALVLSMAFRLGVRRLEINGG